MDNKGFTLVEMMIAVSILAIGIVLVLRSLLNTLSVLDTVQNRVSAICFLEGKMNALEQTAIEEKGVEAGEGEPEKAQIGNRKAVFKVDIKEVESGSEGTDAKEEKEKQKLMKIALIDEVKMNVSWEEGEVSKDETLVTYMPEKEQ